MAKGSTKNGSAPSQRMLTAFERGDVVTARREAQGLVSQPGSEDDIAAARDILARTQVEPATWRYAAFAAAVMVFLVILAVVRS
jgi:hypothetical protein